HNCVSVEQAKAVELHTDKTSVRNELGIAEDSIMALSAGRLSVEKGFSHLLDAISLIAADLPIKFVICGDGAMEMELRDRARSLGIENRCLFAGFRRDIQEVMAASDLYVLPSLTEGLPNVVLEAFSYGKPVVATAVGGVPELVEDGVNGILVPPGEPRALAEAVQALVVSPDLMEEYGKAGRTRVSEEFSFKEQTVKLERIYRDVLGGLK
ncbi:MAG: hypothetical protein C0609_06405, partial [Deltaproteobacteria bacterium]